MFERDYIREHEEDLQRLRGLRPIDDDFMRVLFQGQLALAQEVLRTITGIGDLELVREETQLDLRRLAGARSVCLDVYGRDSRGTEYDLEVQRADRGAQPRRARYHSAAMDVEALEAGEDFEALPESYVIFVTEADLFGKGRGVYRFERADAEDGAALGDGTHVLYANASYEADDELGALMHDFLCSDPDDMRTRSLAERARYFKSDERGVSEMCKVMEDMRNEAMEIGREQGMQNTLFELVRKGLIAIEQAAHELGVTPEQFAELARKAGYKLA